jgi:hypothetical protein
VFYGHGVFSLSTYIYDSGVVSEEREGDSWMKMVPVVPHYLN